MFEEIYEAAFADEIEKIAAEKEIKPGLMKSYLPAMRAYYEKPGESMAEVLKGELKGGGIGLAGGAAAGAAGGGVGALIAKALKKGGKVGKAAGVGALIGGATGLAGGLGVGGTLGYQKAMKKRGVTVKYPLKRLGTADYSFTPAAAKRYGVKA